MQINGSTYKGASYDEVNMGSFKIQVPSPKALGRCFIEVRLHVKQLLCFDYLGHPQYSGRF